MDGQSRLMPEDMRPAMVGVSYVPTVIGVIALATAGDLRLDHDTAGVTGAVMGSVFCVYGYLSGHCCSVASSDRICTLLLAARLLLGMASGVVALVVLLSKRPPGKEVWTHALLYTAFAGLTIAEACLLRRYGAAIRAASKRADEGLEPIGYEMGSGSICVGPYAAGPGLMQAAAPREFAAPMMQHQFPPPMLPGGAATVGSVAAPLPVVGSMGPAGGAQAYHVVIVEEITVVTTQQTVIGSHMEFAVQEQGVAPPLFTGQPQPQPGMGAPAW